MRLIFYEEEMNFVRLIFIILTPLACILSAKIPLSRRDPLRGACGSLDSGYLSQIFVDQADVRI